MVYTFDWLLNHGPLRNRPRLRKWKQSRETNLRFCKRFRGIFGENAFPEELKRLQNMLWGLLIQGTKSKPYFITKSSFTGDKIWHAHAKTDKIPIYKHIFCCYYKKKRTNYNCLKLFNHTFPVFRVFSCPISYLLSFQMI